MTGGSTWTAAGGERLILLFGLPRSGTSWLGKIFDSHPDTLYRHEPDKLCKSREVPQVFPLGELGARREAVEEYLGRLLAVRTATVSGKLPLFPKSYYSRARFRLRKAALLAAKAWPRRLGEVQVPELVDGAGDREGGRGGTRIRLVWKSIQSVGRLGAFLRVLDRARAVLILRHPCGQIHSVLRGEAARRFEGGHPASESYRILQSLVETDQGRAHGLTLAALRAMHPIERLAWSWVLFNEKALADVAGIERCRVVVYEDLCRAPEEEARRLFAGCGLGWTEQSRRFLSESVGGDDDGYYSLTKRPLLAANRWREQLAGGAVEMIHAVARQSEVGRRFVT